MTLNLIRTLIVALVVCCGITQVEAQIAYSLNDNSLSSVVRSQPIRSVASRVRSAAPRVVPTFDRSGRFNREEAYRHNEDRPLAGLFAPDFELTANVFGGWNRIAGFGLDTTADDTFDDDFAVGIAYGRRHNTRLRSEFEFTYRSNESPRPELLATVIPEPLLGEVQVFSIMKNFIIDIESPSNVVTPYVGIGIGYAHLDTDFNRNSGFQMGNTSAFAWQPMGGFSVKLSEIVNYYVEYRYFSTSDLEVSQFGVAQEKTTYNAHDLFMGFRFEF